MKDYIVKLDHINKKFHSFQALKDVSIELKPGKIYGLIGKNGAGKTTIMRMICGLSFPTSGSIELFGETSRAGIQANLKKVGTLIEYPSLNGNMTAKENIKLQKIMKGIHDNNIEDELLEMVELSHTGNKKVKNFSLGMRQRLGIALAMLGKPELVILDEPVNGLDPVGIIEIRKLIKRMCEEFKMTVLISSHNLPELYQTATDYIIINNGEIKQCITLENLENYCKGCLHVASKDSNIMIDIIKNKLKIKNYKVMSDKSVQIYEKYDELEKVSKTFYENGVILTHFAIERETLENYFISVIGGNQNA